MVKTELIQPVTYQGKECKMVCFPCDNNYATHNIIFENSHSKQKMPVCPHCLAELTYEITGAFNEAVKQSKEA